MSWGFELLQCSYGREAWNERNTACRQKLTQPLCKHSSAGERRESRYRHTHGLFLSFVHIGGVERGVKESCTQLTENSCVTRVLGHIVFRQPVYFLNTQKGSCTPHDPLIPFLLPSKKCLGLSSQSQYLNNVRNVYLMCMRLWSLVADEKQRCAIQPH